MQVDKQSGTSEITADGVAPAESPGQRRGRFARLGRWLDSSSPDTQVGTLQYTRRGMLVVFLWLFWGDMVFQLTEQVFPASIGLQLDRLGVGKEWIGLLKGTAASVVSVLLVPLIGYRSDRTRSKRGRRIPYILWTILPVSLTLAALGFTDDIAAWIRSSEWPARLHIAPATLILWVVGTLVALFDVANVFVMTVWWFLLRDVVPNMYIVRFYAAFGVVATMMNIAFNSLFASRVETHTRSLYCGAATLYLGGFLIVCLKVKEGEYPPLETVERREPLQQRFLGAMKLYFRQCFSHPLILMTYIVMTVAAFNLVCQTYHQLYFVRHLNFSLKDQAVYWAWQGVAILIIKYPIGWTIEKLFHPMKAFYYSALLLLPLPWLYFIVGDYSVGGFAISAYAMWVLINMWQCPLTQYYYLSQYPLQAKLYPAEQFGQFMSANTMVTSLVSIVAGVMGAMYMGWATRKFGAYGYGYIFVWQGIFALIGFIATWVTYRYWKLYGAENFRLDLREQAAGSVERHHLWRPVVIGGFAAALVVALGVSVTVVASNRPSLGFDVNVDKELEYSTTLVELHERAARERDGIEKRHRDNLTTLAAKHWFHEKDAVTELRNHEQALSEVKRFVGMKEQVLAAKVQQ